MGQQPEKPKMNATKFLIVLPSAQTDTPPLERSVRLFLQDGMEIFGLVSLEEDDGLVKLSFPKDAFSVKS
jgi:hypothetical protein